MSGTGLYTTDELYRLLPAVYRVRDAEQGGVLRELVDLLTGQVNVLAESLEQAYDDQFVETCAEWVAPYIGDLVGYRTLHGVVPQVASPRAEVANTIRYRRRKGTVSVLEQLAARRHRLARARGRVLRAARDDAVHEPHPPAGRGDGRPPLGVRGSSSPARSRRARSTASRTPAEMRRIASRAGRYNIPNVGIFLWRVAGAPAHRSPLVDADGDRPALPLRPARDGQAALRRPREPRPTSPTSPSRSTCRCRCCAGSRRRTSTRSTAPGSRSLLESETRRRRRRRSRIADIRICDLSDDPARAGNVGARAAAGRHARRDRPGARPRRVRRRAGRGRDAARDLPLRLGARGRRRRLRPRSSLASSCDRRARSRRRPARPDARVGRRRRRGRDPRQPTRTPRRPSIAATTPAAGAADLSLVLQSANRARPLLSRGDQFKLAMEPNTTVVLNGLVLAGAPLVIEEFADTEPRNLILRHCTLVPGLTRDPDGERALGRPRVPDRAAPVRDVTLDHCVVGPVVAVEGAEVAANDSVIDASAAGRDRLLRPRGRGRRRAAHGLDRRRSARPGDGLAYGRAPHARGLHGPRQGARAAARRLELAAARGARRRRRPVAGAGVGRAPAGRLHPLLVRPARLAHAAPVPLRRRRPGRAAVPHLAPLRRPGLHAAPPLDGRRDPHRRERRERDGRHARAVRAAARESTC